MCLFITNDKVPSTRTVAYKVVRDNLYPFYYGMKHPRYKIGEMYVAAGQIDRRKSNYGGELIEGGVIHVYTELEKAQEWKKYFDNDMFAEKTVKILQCEVNPDDWVADGTKNEACYTKVKPINILS